MMVAVSYRAFQAANLREQDWPKPTWIRRQAIFPPVPGLPDKIVKHLVEKGVELMSSGTPDERADGRAILLDVRRIQKRVLRGEW